MATWRIIRWYLVIAVCLGVQVLYKTTGSENVLDYVLTVAFFMGVNEMILPLFCAVISALAMANESDTLSAISMATLGSVVGAIFMLLILMMSFSMGLIIVQDSSGEDDSEHLEYQKSENQYDDYAELMVYMVAGSILGTFCRSKEEHWEDEDDGILSVPPT